MKRVLVLAVVAAAGSSLGFVPGAEAELRVGKNYRLNADPSPFRGKDQPALAVNPANPQHIVEVNVDYLSQACEYSVSLDGGTTWSDAVPFIRLRGFKPTCRVPNHLADQMYQTVAWGRGQNVYATFASPGFSDAGEEGASVLVAKSVDGGRTFGAPVVAMGGGPSNAQSAGPNYELPTITVDPGRAGTAATPTPAPGPAAGPAALDGCAPGGTTIALAAGNDSRNGTPGRDLIFAGTGDDKIDALAGDDCVDLGPGEDRGQGGSGADLVVGGLGDDAVTGSSGNDRLRGDAGNDRVIGNLGNDHMLGGTGNDRMSGEFGNDRLHGQEGADRISGSRGRDRINGGAGNDRIAGDSSSDRINGDSGNDLINGGSGNERIRGNSGNDRIRGDSGNDVLNGGSGRDSIAGEEGNDRIHVRDGRRDRVSCGSGRDSVIADRIDRIGRGCERVRRARVSASAAASATSPTAAAPRAAAPRAAAVAEVPERVYVVATETTEALSVARDVATTVSSDGGRTFSNPVAADPGGASGENATEASQPVVAPDGSVYVAYRNFGVSQDAGVPGPGVARPVKVVRSTDHGRTWRLPVTAALVTAGGTTSTSHITPQISTASTFPRLAVDKGSGNLYLVYGQGPPGPTAGPFGFEGADHFIHLDSDVYFQRSRTDGATWSVPKRINDATPHPGSEVTQTRHPNVYVAPNGRVDIVWEDRRHWYQPPDGERRCIHTHLRCDEARLGDTYYAFSKDGGDTFTERRINDRSHNNDVGYDYRFGVGWAFGPVAVPLGNDRLLVAWMDSREGNFDNDNLDIYLAKVNHAASGAVPQEAIQAANPTDLSVGLSRRAYPGGGESLMQSNFATRRAARPVIVNEGDVAGTLAASVLARANLGPVLLSPVGGLPANVKAEVDRLDPVGAYVIGDATNLSPTVEADLIAAGVPAGQVVRISGATPADTAAAIATTLDRRRQVEKDANTPAFDAVVIARPNSPEASAVATLAAARRLPVLYTDAAGTSIPAATAAALADLDINKTLVIGNVTDAGLPNPTRLGGADQYAVSRAVVDESRARGMPDNIAFAVDGAKPLNGALLGSAAGRINGLQLLTPAPLATTAPSTASTMGLTPTLDQLILVDTNSN